MKSTAISMAAFAESQPKPAMKQMKSTLGKLLRRPKTREVTSGSAGPHWRRSVNVMLQSHSTSKTSAAGSEKLSVLKEDAQEAEPCEFLRLPKEIRQLIEDYLPRVDAVCLRQTCQALRQESKSALLVQNLSAKQLYTLRTRLDRECFWQLCALEKKRELGSQLAVCSFCQSVHDRKSFPAIQLQLFPQERVCTAASKDYLMCGNYHTTPSRLRCTLQEVLSTGREEWRMHHWIAQADLRRNSGDTHIVLSRAIEKDNRLPERRSTLLVEDTGLVLEHHFHLQSQSTLLPIGWNITSALAHPSKGSVPICPHHTIQSAGTKLHHRAEAHFEGSQRCRAERCRTDFAFFECPNDSVGWKDLCFRVKKNFGWIEHVTDEFWEAQSRRAELKESGYSILR